MWGDKTIFVDPALQAQVWKEGFAVRPFLSRDEVASVKAAIDAILSKNGVDLSPTNNGFGDFHESGAHPNRDYRKAICDMGGELLADRAKAFLPGYRYTAAALFVKPPGRGALDLHADNALHDDVNWPSITIWCALSDTNEANGTLEFVPGSHSIYDFPITNNGSRPYAQALPTLSRLAVPQPVSCGDAIFFDTTILHGSKDNRTETPRMALLIGMVPENVRPVVYQVSATNPEVTKILSMDGKDRIEHQTTDVRLGKVETEVIGRIATPGITLTSDEMMAVIDHGEMLRDKRTTIAAIKDAMAKDAPPPNAARSAGRTIFRSPSHDADFARSGFVSAQLLSPENAAQMLDDVLKLAPDDDYDPAGRFGDQVTYHMTELDTNFAYKRKVRDLAQHYLGESIDQLLVDYRVLTTTLFVKPPGKGKIPLHTDWTVQEDLSWPTVYIWCPLEDVEAANGPLSIYAGSHGVIDFLHGPQMTAPYTVDDSEVIGQMTSIPVKAGEAVVFDAGALHWSPDNDTDRPRFAVRLACIPRHRRGVLFRQSPDDADLLEIFSMETEEFEAHNGQELIAGAFKTQMLGKCVNPHLRLDGDEIAALVARGDEIRSGQITSRKILSDMRSTRAAAQALADRSRMRRTPYQRARSLAGRIYRRARRDAGRTVRAILPSAGQVPAGRGFTGPDYAPYPALPAPWQPFGNAGVNAALNEHGYATTHFLSPAEVDRLAEIIDAAAERLDRENVHIPTHFMLSAFNNDGAYKERLFDSVWAFLEAKVGAVLPGYEPLVINMFDKLPGDAYDPVPIHQNPSFVDEPAHKSVSLWIPLCDVDRTNGTVGVMPGSHNRFNAVRAGNMAHEDIFADVQKSLEDELFVPVVMAKGEMLALDDTILHWSYPNISPTRRAAVQLIMVPKGVPHIYYYYDDSAPDAPMMDRYKVDRHFFFGFNCKARPETLEHIDRVPYHYRRITQADLQPSSDG